MNTIAAATAAASTQTRWGGRGCCQLEIVNRIRHGSHLTHQWCRRHCDGRFPPAAALSTHRSDHVAAALAVAAAAAVTASTASGGGVQCGNVQGRD
jgi:hypothetical protein